MSRFYLFCWVLPTIASQTFDSGGIDSRRPNTGIWKISMIEVFETEIIDLCQGPDRYTCLKYYQFKLKSYPFTLQSKNVHKSLLSIMRLWNFYQNSSFLDVWTKIPFAGIYSISEYHFLVCNETFYLCHTLSYILAYGI